MSTATPNLDPARDMSVPARTLEWDERPSGFRKVLLGPVLVLLGWLLASAAAVYAIELLDGHHRATGLGVSGFWLALVLLVLTHLVLLGVGFIFHRHLTHRACRLHPAIAYPLLLLALPAGSPVQWVGNHRHHHAETDEKADWHSPQAHGFWAAHAGWYIYSRNPLLCALYTFAGPLRMLFDAFWRPQTNQEYVALARDVAREPFYAWVSRPTPYAFFVVAHVAVTWCAIYLIWGTSAFVALYAVQAGYFVIGDGVNSILHMWGHRPFVTKDASTNLPILGLLAVGEGYHNAHHAFPKSLRTGLLPGQFDLVYVVARALERLGLCSDIYVPRTREILARLQDERYRPYFQKRLARENEERV